MQCGYLRAVPSGRIRTPTAYNGLNQYSQLSVPPVVHPVYDLDGNMISNGVRNTYDHRSRRIRKEVSRRGAGTQNGEAERTHAYLWDGCNVVRETVAIGSGSS